MRIEQDNGHWFRFRLDRRDFQFDDGKSANRLVDLLKTLPQCDRSFEAGIWRVDVRHRGKVMDWMMETICPREWELVPVDSLDQLAISPQGMLPLTGRQEADNTEDKRAYR